MHQTRKTIFTAIALMLFIFSGEGISHAMDHHWGKGRPYGGYCRGKGWGWYGAKKAVKTKNEASKILHEYYRGEKVVIGDIIERKWYFEADIKDEGKGVIDRVMVNKKTGRIRSIY